MPFLYFELIGQSVKMNLMHFKCFDLCLDT